MTSASSPPSSSGVRTSMASAPSSATIRACAAKSPWLASTPTRRRSAPVSGGTVGPAPAKGLGPAVLEELALGGELCDVVAAHRLAELTRGFGDALRVLEVRGRLDDGPGAPLRIARLEDARADEVALRAELHRERCVRGRRDAARAEQRDRQPAGLGHLRDDLERRLKLLGDRGQLFATGALQLADPADDPAQMPHGLDDVAGPGLAL